MEGSPLAGHRKVERPRVTVTVRDQLHSDGRETYVRAWVTRTPQGYQAVSTGSQGSHVMTSLVKANGLMIIPEGVTTVYPGDQLQAMMIDWPETVF